MKEMSRFETSAPETRRPTRMRGRRRSEEDEAAEARVARHRRNTSVRQPNWRTRPKRPQIVRNSK